MLELVPKTDAIDGYDEGALQKADSDRAPGQIQEGDVELRFPAGLEVPTPISALGSHAADSNEVTAPPHSASGEGLLRTSGAEAVRQRRPHGEGALQHFRGRNVLCLHGRCVLGPPDSYKTMTSTVLLITIPTSLFLAIPGVELWALGYPAVTVMGGVIAAFTLSTLWSAAVTDPGILPRWPRPSLEDGAVDSAGEPLVLPMISTFHINGGEHQLKLCATCNIYRSPKVSHCSDCDNCVLDLDHHCPWVGTCIGRRNYLSFVGFVLGCTLLCLHVLGACILSIWAKKQAQDGDDTAFNMATDVQAFPAQIVLIIYTFILVWSVGSLSCFHVVLLCQGKTTREYIKGTHDPSHRSGDASRRWQRLVDVCCSNTPSYIHILRERGREDTDNRGDGCGRRPLANKDGVRGGREGDSGASGRGVALDDLEGQWVPARGDLQDVLHDTYRPYLVLPSNHPTVIQQLRGLPTEPNTAPAFSGAPVAGWGQGPSGVVVAHAAVPAAVVSLRAGAEPPSSSSSSSSSSSARGSPPRPAGDGCGGMSGDDGYAEGADKGGVAARVEEGEGVEEVGEGEGEGGGGGRGGGGRGGEEEGVGGGGEKGEGGRVARSPRLTRLRPEVAETETTLRFQVKR